MEFYDQLKRWYDRMTRDRTRWIKIEEQYRPYLEEFAVKHLIDAGCGTGGEAIALAKMGIDVIGVDLSSELIRRARRKAKLSAVKGDFRVDDIREMSTVSPAWGDLLICRGNTLPHILSTEDMVKTLSSFRRCVRLDGGLLLSWLNYKPILENKRRLVGISGSWIHVYVRFYDFREDGLVNFNILHLERRKDWKGEILSTTLKPWLPDDVGMLAVRCGWTDLELYSDLSKNPFDPDDSRDVVLIARAK